MRVWRGAVGLCLAAWVTLALAAGPLLSPAGAAYLKAERSRIERDFVAQVAGIAGVEESVVRRGMPDGPRITDTGRRVIATIEQSTGRPLTDAQRQHIETADAQRLDALARAREEAARH